MDRLRLAALVAAASSLALVGCPQKKEPPKEATPVVEAPPPPKPPPPAAAEPQAVKECAAPVDVAPPTEVKVGERAAKSTGYKLSFADKDADGSLNLGVLGPINEDSGQNLLALKKYLKFFQDEKADAILVTGDVGEVADGISRVLKTLAASNLPVLVIAGNRECRAEYSDGVSDAKKEHSNVVNMNEVRAVELPELTLVSLPGYHDPNYITCATGCRYFKSTVDEVIRMAKEAKGPVLLIAHGPPHGDGSQALDYAAAGGNVGDAEINRAIREGNIAFGAFSNIKEAGARATSDPEGTTQLRPGSASKTVFLNPGPADTVGWEMNDGTKSVGLAAVLSLKEGQGTFKLFRAKPLTAAEKAEAKKLDPPLRAEGEEAPEAPAPAPAPAPNQPPPGEPGK
ncbi:MAG: metallophosphoesterase [Myxococcales bacterium]|nr:metallophosphoesterase [Myxococcales bacterium]